MRKEHWLFLALTLVLIFLIFFEPGWGFRVGNFLRGGGEGAEAEPDTLLAENQSLKTRIAELENIREQTFWDSKDFISAAVFSRYPFSLKNELLINAGLENKIATGQAVVVAYKINDTKQPILLGRVIKVFPKTALVQTIFDPTWQSSVRIGRGGSLALLKGGNEPRVVLIPKEETIGVREVVYSVSPDLPHAVVLGEIYDISLSSDQVFQEGRLKLAYDFSGIKAVSVIKDEPKLSQ